MDPIAAVLVGHLIGDWIVQTDWQAANKVRPEFTKTNITILKPKIRKEYWNSWKANQQHMLGYHLTLMFFMSFSMFCFTRAVIIIFISWFTHSFIDRRWPVQKLMKMTKSEPFSQTTFGIIAVDQALHLSILLILAGIL